MDELADYEHRFRRAGLPLLIEDYSASQDVYTRATPLLVLVFVAETLGAVDLKWSWYANLAAVLGALGVAVGALALANRVAGRRTLSVPESVGRTELAGFVLVPTALPMVFNGQVLSGLVTGLFNLALLGLIYLVVGFGVLSIVRWAAGRLLGELASSVAALARAIPLLMVFALLLFLTQEMWQVFTTVSDAALATVTGMFVALGTIFLAGRLPREVKLIEHATAGAAPALDRRQRFNVGLVMFVSQALQVLVVSIAVGGFFIAFGVLTLHASVYEQWIGHGGHAVGPAVHALGEKLQITRELLQVSGALAAFSGLYYAIAVLTDSTYREEFLEDLTGELRETFSLRAEYLDLRARTAAAEQAAAGA